MDDSVATTPALVKKHYDSLGEKTAKYRKVLGRPLTLSEKILYSHLDQAGSAAELEKGKSFIMLRPDRVAMQDATAQMAILQFIQAGKKRVAVPSTVHCDHLIRAHMGADKDLKVADDENAEVFNFLRSASEKYGIGFWGPGAGIIHQVVLENYAFPGGMMIGTDSHTPNAGGLGMLAIGVGGADAVDVMAGMPWELLHPKVVGVRLKGRLSGWTSSKDVILKVLEKLTVKGGTNRIMEYFGDGAESLSCTGKGTITNMGAELGATTSTFPFDEAMAEYLRGTGRPEIASLAEAHAEHLRADPEVLADPGKYYDEVIEIDLDALEPYIVGPHSPDKARPVSKMSGDVAAEDYPEKVSAALIGSCTNSSYEDIYRAASLAKAAIAKGIKSKCPVYVSPGSVQVYETVKRDGLLQTLEEFGAVTLANACGPCIGQWQRDEIEKGERNSIVTSFNRNFRARNDANPETYGFITSPDMVIAYAASGSLNFNPLTDTIATDAGEAKLPEPQGPALPKDGFVATTEGYQDPAADGSGIEVEVKPGSERLELLKPFAKWGGGDFVDHLLLVKVAGKCTTDHISPAGKWLRFRGHLDRISDNMLLGGNNAYYDEAGQGTNALDGSTGSLSAIARDYKAKGKSWVIVGDENYGEGSSREHAAMSPRMLGASTVIVKSFARIHETNLKKQGVLALTFKDTGDYEKITEGDLLSVTGLASFAPGKSLTLQAKHKDGKIDEIELAHSYNEEQIAWFKAGSALNLIS